MKRTFFFLLTFIFMTISANAGPFGLNMGMTIEDITEACGGKEPEYIADDRYFIEPLKSHPLFEGYIVWINKEDGLYYIKGISKEVKTTGYGTEIKREFENLLSSLERKYDKFQKINRIDRNSYQQDDKDFMRSIAYGARTYEALWQVTEKNFKNFDNLATIALGIKTRATYISDEAYIWIEYGFSNQFSGFGKFDDVL